MNGRVLLSMNGVGLVLIVGSFIVSLGMVLSRSAEQSPTFGEAGGKKIVRIMHWQLEPGYREAMQQAIDAYNALPHVVEANVEMRQLGVSEGVYAQILNVHAVSGTAPDLCEKGMSVLVNGAGVAQFFDPLSDLAAQPNPYNRVDMLPDRLQGDAAEAYARLPWGETFIDGMQGGYIEELQDIYAVSISYGGGLRLFYNEELFAEAMRVLKRASHAEVPPPWFMDLFLRESGTDVQGYVEDTPELRAWIDSGEAPDTLGRMLMLCGAMRQLAREQGDDRLVPIAGGGYAAQVFAIQYLVPFTASYAEALNFDRDRTITATESWFGWRDGVWSFEDPAVAAYFDCLRTLCEQFPPGFLGLDREQARRRFITGQAGMLATGFWDAKSINEAAEGVAIVDNTALRPGDQVTMFEGRRMRNHRFGVATMPFPIPGPHERWSRYVTYEANNANANGTSGFMVYQRSPNKKWAIDFLQFLTSLRVNEAFNRRANWLPICVGAQVDPAMSSFAPDPHGLSPNDHINFTGTLARQITSRFDGDLKNFMSGDITYRDFTGSVEAAANDPRAGVERTAFDSWRADQDRVRKIESLIGLQTARQLLQDRDDAQAKMNRAVLQSAKLHNAVLPRFFWSHLFPEEPFPEY